MSQNENKNSSSTEIIGLNIGGVYFTTTKSTLCSQESMLKNMFHFPLCYDQNKRIFIDRDGKHFRYILNFLRDNYIDIPSDVIVQNELLREAQYYCFDNLIEFLQQDTTPFNLTKEFNYVGRWESPSDYHVYNFKMNLKVKEDADEQKSEVPIEGCILWSLEKTPANSHVKHRVGDYGREFVEGTFDREKFKMEFHGVRLDVSAMGLIALDYYQIQFREDGHSFQGKTRGHHNRWDNLIEGKTEELIRKEKIEKHIKDYHQNKAVTNDA